MIEEEPKREELVIGEDSDVVLGIACDGKLPGFKKNLLVKTSGGCFGCETAPLLPVGKRGIEVNEVGFI